MSIVYRRNVKDREAITSVGVGKGIAVGRWAIVYSDGRKVYYLAIVPAKRNGDRYVAKPFSGRILLDSEHQQPLVRLFEPFSVSEDKHGNFGVFPEGDGYVLIVRDHVTEISPYIRRADDRYEVKLYRPTELEDGDEIIVNLVGFKFHKV
ncbi:MAG: hypothetical protein J7K98_02770 [Candidatus Aenigmarchaeota archaeon]|nr:hypothetical protein [Candidatus Aenigmarchaeota archaeon]